MLKNWVKIKILYKKKIILKKKKERENLEREKENFCFTLEWRVSCMRV